MTRTVSTRGRATKASTVDETPTATLQEKATNFIISSEKLDQLRQLPGDAPRHQKGNAPNSPSNSSDSEINSDYYPEDPEESFDPNGSNPVNGTSLQPSNLSLSHPHHRPFDSASMVGRSGPCRTFKPDNPEDY